MSSAIACQSPWTWHEAHGPHWDTSQSSPLNVATACFFRKFRQRGAHHCEIPPSARGTRAKVVCESIVVPALQERPEACGNRKAPGSRNMGITRATLDFDWVRVLLFPLNDPTKRHRQKQRHPFAMLTSWKPVHGNLCLQALCPL